MESPWPERTVKALRAITFVCDVITFPVYYLIQQPWIKQRLAKRIKAEPISKDDKQITYRSVNQPGPVHVSMVKANVDTMDKMLSFATKLHQNEKCLGTRKILSEEDEVQPNGRVFKKFTMGDYEWQSYADVERLAEHFGRGLRELGHEERQNVVIFAETRAEWMIAAHGCFRQNFPVVTIYATLGDDGVIHGINESESTVVITSHDLLPKFKALLPQLPKVRVLVYMEDQLKPTNTDGFKEDVQILPYKQVVQKGSTSNAIASAPSTNDVAIIMYTSGSTGTPKGVLLLHKNCIAALKGFVDAIHVRPGDILLGLLPLAHVFEILSESICLLSGIPVGYSSPTTLTDSSSKIKKGGKGDVSVLRPTCMISVPLILDRVVKEVNNKVNSGTPMQKALFHFAYDYKRKWTQRGFRTPLFDILLFKKIAKVLGGRMRELMTGGAPLAPETQEFFKLCMCCRVTQGYGLTESTAGATTMDAYDASLGRVGCPITPCDIRLCNWEEAGYRVTNKPYPQGEIIIGGDNIAQGYFKMEQKTAEDFFDEDGRRWFKTGDIGEFHEDGVLKIIDRKKDLVKLQAGEYISLGKIETEFKTCPIVDNICVYADSTKQFIVALIVPNQKHLRDLAYMYGVSGTLAELCASPEVNKAVIKELTTFGLKHKLQRFEIPSAITLCKDVWTAELGLLTAAQKLKRKEIQDYYKEDIKRMYSTS